MSNNEEIIQAAARVLFKAVLELIQNDSHQWSTRPCATCNAVSSIMGMSFGCKKFAEDRRK